VHLICGQIDVFQYFAGRATLAEKYVEQSGKFGRFVNAFTHSNDRSFLCGARNGARSGRAGGLIGFAQLNPPFDSENGSKFLSFAALTE
jgi:hypothetical protein